MSDTTQNFATRYAALAIEFQRASVNLRDSEGIAAEKRDRRLMAWLGFSALVLDDLAMYKKPIPLARPAILPESDFTLWSLLDQRKRKGAKSTQEAREASNDYLAWTSKVRIAEQDAGSHLRIIMDCVRHLAMIEDPGATQMEQRLRVFVHQEYDMPLPQPIPDEKDEREKFIAKTCTDLIVMPLWMRNHSRPHGVYPQKQEESEGDADR